MFRIPVSVQSAVAAGLVAAGLIGAPIGHATEYTAFVPIWIAPDDGAAAATWTLPGLLSIPPAWQAGGGAAIVIGEPAMPGGPRDGVVARLLGEGALVLELDVFTARGVAADSAATPPLPDVAALVRDLFAGLAVLRREYDPGLVVALGFGLGGEAARQTVGVPLPRGVTGFVAGADYRHDTIRFARGPAPDAEESWPLRVRSLCRALIDPALADGDAALRRCLVALRHDVVGEVRR